MGFQSGYSGRGVVVAVAVAVAVAVEEAPADRQECQGELGRPGLQHAVITGTTINHADRQRPGTDCNTITGEHCGRGPGRSGVEW